MNDEVAMRQNLTIQLEADTIRKARILAAKRSLSISRLLASEIERLVREDDSYEIAKNEELAELEGDFDLGSGDRLPKRDELHER